MNVESKWMVILGILLGIIGILITVIVLIRRPDSPTGQRGMKQAVAQVGRIMLLPEDEVPTYGTVDDKAKLSKQTFFAKAQNGDEILIYEKARLTILYRSSIHKIVNVGPLVVGNQGTPYVTSKIALLNGTSDVAKLERMAEVVRRAFPNAAVVSQGNASREYPTTIAADLGGKNQPLIEQVADSLRIQGGKLPLGEPAPAGDILILIGADYK